MASRRSHRGSLDTGGFALWREFLGLSARDLYCPRGVPHPRSRLSLHRVSSRQSGSFALRAAHSSLSATTRVMSRTAFTTRQARSGEARRAISGRIAVQRPWRGRVAGAQPSAPWPFVGTISLSVNGGSAVT